MAPTETAVDTSRQATQFTVIMAHRAGVAIEDIAAASGMSIERIARIIRSEPADFPWNTVSAGLLGR
jgi:ribulose 1,5-bisphosphate carboxylase large subunit-like protein